MTLTENKEIWNSLFWGFLERFGVWESEISTFEH